MATIQERLNKIYCLFVYNGETILAYKGSKNVWIKDSGGNIINLALLRERRHRFFIESRIIESSTCYRTGYKVIVDNDTWYVVDWQSLSCDTSDNRKYSIVIAK